MRVLTLTTPYGDVRYIHDNGVIERDDQPGQQSGGWTFTGMVRTGPGWAFGTGLIPLAEILANGPGAYSYTYKNGTPRFTGQDQDHGTTRIWGNPKYHGIRAITRYRD